MLYRICLLVFLFLPACRKKAEQQEDTLYSKHLQRNVKLTIIHTPIPEDPATLNLLILNDGQLAAALGLRQSLDSLYREKQIPPLLIVAVHADNRYKEFGMAALSKKGNAGEKADHYESFINNELYPYARKKAGVRKFNSLSMAGFGNSALSTFDFSWNHAERITKCAVFSGAFNRVNDNGKDTSSTGDLYQFLQSSRKRPKLRYWFYAGQTGNTALPQDDAADILKHTSSIAGLLRSKSFIQEEDVTVSTGTENNITAWKAVIPDFLQWISR